MGTDVEGRLPRAARSSIIVELQAVRISRPELRRYGRCGLGGALDNGVGRAARRSQ
jgi:hypothetical protein